MILLLDVGNTNTHVALASESKVLQRLDFPTNHWAVTRIPIPLVTFAPGHLITGISYCQVVPRLLTSIERFTRSRRCDSAELTASSVTGLKFHYPHPETLGGDRVARVLAAVRLHGSPVVCLGFGTALTVEVVDAKGRFVGGIIAPGITAFRDYLRYRTAQLPGVSLRPVGRFIGRSTEEAMRIGCVNGFHEMVSALIRRVCLEMGKSPLVVATGAYAKEAASKIPEIKLVNPDLTFEGLRRFWLERPPGKPRKSR